MKLQNKMHMKAYMFLAVIGIAALLAAASCKKEVVPGRSGKDPYGDTIRPAVVLNRKTVVPEEGRINDTVMVFGTGFSGHRKDLIISFNGRSAKILSVTDTSAKVVVPPMASTGNISAQVGQEYSFGPFFRVNGLMEVDQSFPSIRGANGTIEDILALPDDKYLIVGAFTNYDNANIDGGVNRVALINHDGTLNRNFAYGKKLNGKVTGSPSTVNAAAVLPDGKLIVAGGFGSYDGYSYINSIARLYPNGQLDTMTVDRPSGDTLEVSALKGGVLGTVTDVQLQDDGKMILTGFFRYYVQMNYNLTAAGGRDSLHLDSTMVNYIVRLNPDGSLDKTYNFDVANDRGKTSVNGAINKSILLPDGKLIIAGAFTKYNGQDANRIARLNPDGSLDPSFHSGTGADQVIYDIDLQPDGKYVIGGAFNQYDGKAMPHVARLNADGSLDPAFTLADGPNGSVIQTGVLPDGKVIVSGYFIEFDEVIRNGFAILNPDGALNTEYNTNGGFSNGGENFSGIVTQILQLPDEYAYLMTGSFTKFDRYTCNRIMKIMY